MTNADERFQSFRGVASIALSVLLGILITIPLSSESHKYMPLIGIAAGLLVGLRRRKSVSYFYFVLIACGVMTTLLLSQLTID